MDARKRLDAEVAIFKIARKFLKEQDMERAVHVLTLEASLERDLGIDSLGKVELFSRVEKALSVRFSDAEIANSDSLQDIVSAVLSAKTPKTDAFLFSSDETVKPVLPLTSCTTLAEVLYQHAETDPDRVHLYLMHDIGDETPMTYGELLEGALRVAATLQRRGIGHDDVVAIMLPTGLQFFKIFMGIILAGAIPLPLYPPYRPDRIREYALREARILANAQARCLVIFDAVGTLGKILKSCVPSLRLVVQASTLSKSAPLRTRTDRKSDDTALLQYTSGSTDDPKGVMLQHQQILSNIRSIGQALDLNPSDAMVSWLPLYHDMGLMSWLGSLYFGIPLVIMSPISFLSRPERWLWAIHYHRATLSAGPNFAYALCVKKIDPAEMEGLDLSSWRLAFNGAEAVSSKTLLQFYERFRKVGFQKSALFPGYGLAENTVGLTLPKPGSLLSIDSVDRVQLELHGLAELSHGKNALEFVSVGRVLEGSEIRIADTDGRELPERTVGAVQFRGQSAMVGYYRNLRASLEAYHNGWWDTGDLGYQVGGNLYITGRKKDLIIKAGRNIYPESIEEAAARVTGIRKGCVIAFGVSNPETGTEQLIVTAETAETNKHNQALMEAALIYEISTAIGLPPDKVLLVPPHAIPKTSSGKLQRQACKQSWLSGTLGRGAKSRRAQGAWLLWHAARAQLASIPRFLLRLLYTAYAVLLFVVFIVPVYLSILLAPAKATFMIARFWARVLIRMLVRLRVQDLTEKPRTVPQIWCSNHASYTDAFILFGILPAGTRFVGKKELFRVPFLGALLRKLRTIPVDRFEFARNIEDTKTISNILIDGESVTIFPEGTFTYATGLRPFRTGAFQLAAVTGTPICPVSIRNSRTWLRGGSWLLTPTSITVTLCESLVPVGKEWDEAIRLRKQARIVIAAHCGEDVLDLVHSGPDTSHHEHKP